MLTWVRQRRTIGLAMIVLAPSLIGYAAASAATSFDKSSQTALQTITSTKHTVKFVTVHVKGRVIHRFDHVLVVFVPRTVFHTHTTPSRRVVVPAHIVRIKRRQQVAPPFGVTSAIIGVAPPPVTIEVPVTVTVPGPTTTVTNTVTATETTTTTDFLTVTVTVPLPPPEGP